MADLKFNFKSANTNTAERMAEKEWYLFRQFLFAPTTTHSTFSARNGR